MTSVSLEAYDYIEICFLLDLSSKTRRRTSLSKSCNLDKEYCMSQMSDTGESAAPI